MIDDDIETLSGEAPDCSLDDLERDLWLRVAGRLGAQNVSRQVVTIQMVMLVVALAFSTVVGNRLGHATAERSGHYESVMASGMELAPSTLLLGHRT